MVKLPVKVTTVGSGVGKPGLLKIVSVVPLRIPALVIVPSTALPLLTSINLPLACLQSRSRDSADADCSRVSKQKVNTTATSVMRTPVSAFIVSPFQITRQLYRCLQPINATLRRQLAGT